MDAQRQESNPHGQITGEEFKLQAIFKGKLAKKRLTVRKVLHWILRLLLL